MDLTIQFTHFYSRLCRVLGRLRKCLFSCCMMSIWAQFSKLCWRRKKGNPMTMEELCDESFSFDDVLKFKQWKLTAIKSNKFNFPVGEEKLFRLVILEEENLWKMKNRHAWEQKLIGSLQFFSQHLNSINILIIAEFWMKSFHGAFWINSIP